jgi:integrase
MKSMARELNRLKAKFVSGAKAPGKYGDGGGLWLIVDKTGSQRWILNYQRDGKRHEMGLGSASVVTLAEARDRRDECHRLIAAGVDPIQARKAEQEAAAGDASIPFFGDFAAKVAESRGLKRDKQLRTWKALVGPKYLPSLQKVRVNEVTPQLVVKDLAAIWHAVPMQARKVQQRLEIVLDAARVAQHIRGPWENPGRWKGNLELHPALGKQRHKVKHHAALAHEEVGSFLAKLRERTDLPARALEIVILTAVRSDVALTMRFGDLDLDQAVWIADMKTVDAWRVPLSPPVVAMLREILPEDWKDHPEAYVFPSRRRMNRSGRMSESAMLRVIEDMGRKGEITTHGFRTTFRTWGAKQKYPDHLLERCLSHVVGSEAQRAYDRDDYLDERREIMDAWAERVADPAQDKVVPFKKKAA